MQYRFEGRRTPVTLLAAAVGLALQMSLHGAYAQTPELPTQAPADGAQETPAASPPADVTDLDAVQVVGYRASLRRALDEKRYSVEQVDAIFAEDIGKFPDLNLAESLQRIAGVSIDREAGEGRQISVRGLGSDFTRVRINGLEALSTSGQGADGPNRSRGFDFNTFASELFNEVKVSKTQSAQMDEGSLGSTVDLRVARPFDYDGFESSLNAQAGYNDLSGENDPRFSGLISNTWADGRFGALLSVAYSERNLREEGFNPVRFDHGNYRNAGLRRDVDDDGAVTRDDNNQFGFCSPKGYTPQTPRDPLGEEIEDGDENNGYGSFGIDADHCANGIERPEGTPENIAAYETATNSWHPRYPAWRRSTHEIERLGVTGALQFRISDDTLLGLDLMYAKYRRDQREDTLGANLHRAVNLGGKTEIIVREAEVDDMNRLVYGVFDNVDFRSESVMFVEETEFKQYNLDFEHGFGEDVRLNATVGHSESNYARPINSLVSIDNSNLQGFVWGARESLKSPTMTFPFDLTSPDAWDWLGYGSVPVNDNGSARGVNISEVRLNPQYVDNSFDTVKVDTEFVLNPTFTLRSGLAWKDYDMDSQEFRHINFGLLPAALPDGTGVGDVTQTLTDYGSGLDGDAPGSWLVPNFDQVADLLGIYCNCDTDVPGGDYTLSSVGHFGATGNNFAVNERSLGTYLQLDFNTDFIGRPLRGNVGVRYVSTAITSSGWAPCAAPEDGDPGDAECAGSQPFYGLASASATPRERYMAPLVASHDYSDTLPSLNVAWNVTDEVVLRFGAAKVMARPALQHLSPAVSGAPTALRDEGTLYSINAGNPQLDPFRATTYDLSAEWYFNEDSLLSAAVFYKDIDNYIQRVRQVMPWSQTGWPLEFLPPGFDGSEFFSVQSYFNTPGGPLKGFELTYQQAFTFLPGFWGNFGFQANYTRVKSRMNYVASSTVDDDMVVTTEYVENDLINMSPHSYNATLYYDDGRFSARVSTSYRDRYLTTILVPEEVIDLDGNELLTPAEQGKYASRNYDFNMSYKVNDKLSLTFEATNLTDTFDDRYADSQLQMPLRYTHTGRQYYIGARYKF